MQIITRQAEGKPLTVTIEYPEYTESVKGLVERIRSLDVSFSVTSDEGLTRISVADVYYIENIDRKVFLYTERDVYRIGASMREVEELIKGTDLVRISGICMMNTSHLTGIRQLKNSRLEATLDNGEKLIVSRRYLSDIKRRF